MKLLRTLLLRDDHVCPWWLAYTFDNPLRRILHPPEKVLSGLVSQGQTVLDIGCGMGHFSLGMARMVGEHGRVIALDLQDQMLDRVRRRAEKQRLSDRLILHKGEVAGLDMKGEVDFALAFWMVHEVPDQHAFFQSVKGLLKPNGRLLVAEPKIHTSKADLIRSLKIAADAGLKVNANPDISFSRTALLTPVI
ncbi:MAG: class I SAM-dependent methyltransferase [Desulfomonilia bacterium]|jgi:ubiquinone/menaquinone biosynthesis C-methylase UbiE